MLLAPLLLAGTGCAAGTYSWAACVPSAQLFGRTIRRTGDSRTIALTFDDGPNPAVTPELLDLLDRHAIRATFFLIGAHVRACPDLAREVARRGHVIGNHTDTHPALPLLSGRKISQELDRCDEAIRSATDVVPRWMRPPYGFRSPLLNGIVARRNGAGVVMWSRLARDWKPQPSDPVVRRLRRVRGGDIVLLHDGAHRTLGGDRRHTVQALANWIPRWKDMGLRMVTLDEIASAQPRTHRS
ncbi:MAG TPA: polysaccharide deacetylase family protein [Candidatus Acidoferrales bacterium]|nr:polysaccharide deacetylase family protein [Candidatus Acidoferrales bacterium]